MEMPKFSSAEARQGTPDMGGGGKMKNYLLTNQTV